jgi:GNAT superfamily N-acetyltransferase
VPGGAGLRRRSRWPNSRSTSSRDVVRRAVAIHLADLPTDIIRRLPAYPVVPATLLGRLAVDQSRRGQGVGEYLLVDALHRAYAQSSQIAAFAVVVEAIDEAAERFYRHFDFLPFPDRRQRLFLPMKTVAALSTWTAPEMSFPGVSEIAKGAGQCGVARSARCSHSRAPAHELREPCRL